MTDQEWNALIEQQRKANDAAHFACETSRDRALVTVLGMIATAIIMLAKVLRSQAK